MKLHYDREGEIGRITLSAPARDGPAEPSFEEVARLTELLSEPGIKGAVVGGEARRFGAGLERADGCAAAFDERQALLDAIAFATVPVVAMVRGACLGTGLEIALACHFRLASDDALLGPPESGLGPMTGLGRTGRPRERVGDRHAPAPVLPDRPVGADEALSMGLVDAVVPAADLERRSLAFVRSLVADRPGHVVRAVMESIRNARRMPPEQALRREGQLFLEVARATRALSTRGPDHG